MHTSGRHGLAVLDAGRAVGARPVALHPAMTFTGTAVDLGRLAGCVFGLTAGAAERAFAEALVADLGGRAMWVPEEMRTLYHAGLAHGANHLVTLVTQAMELLAAAGADDPAGTLRPLLTAALDNALDQGDAALTGPIVRGDVNTVRAHLADIAGQRARTRCRRTSPWRGPPSTASSPTAGCCRSGRRRSVGVLDAAVEPAARRRRRSAAAGPAAMSRDPVLAHTREELADLLAAARGRVAGSASCPTMGALHEGHASLMRVARERVGRRRRSWSRSSSTRCSSAPGEDLDRYPRTLDADLEMCEREGVDIVFAPAVEEVYPGRRAAGHRRARPARPPSSRARPGPATSAAC